MPCGLQSRAGRVFLHLVAHRTLASASCRGWLVLSALLLASPVTAQTAPAAAKAVSPATLSTPTTPQAHPGEYASLMVQASGQGEYDLSVEGAPGWEPVTRQRHLTLNGSTLVALTFRVPPGTPVGLSPAVTVRLSAGSQVVAQASGHVEVLPQTKLAVRSPEQLTGQTKRRLTFEVQFTNQGNQDDVLSLRVVNVDQKPQLSTETLRLRPGETAPVTVSLTIGDASPGYEYLVAVEARSRNDPDFTVRSRTNVTFNPVGSSQPERGDQPQLAFGVSSGLDAELDWGPDGRRASFSYSVAPRVTGRLSDDVGAEASLSGLTGRPGAWAPRGSDLTLALRAPTWDLRLSAGMQGAAFSVNVMRGRWRLSPRAGVSVFGAGRSALRGGLGVSGPLLGGVLEGDVGTNLSRQPGGNARTDQLSVRYTRPLSTSTQLQVGAAAFGLSDAEGAARWSGLGYEQLTYADGRFDVTQAYAGTTEGLHSFSVSGGLTTLRPLGLRAALSVTSQPRGVTVVGSGLLNYAAPSGLSFGVGGRYQTSTLPGSVPAWSVTGSVQTPALNWHSAHLSGAASYTLHTVPDVPGRTGQAAAGTLSLNAGALRADARAAWSRDPQPHQQTLDTLHLGLTGHYQLRSSDLLAAELVSDQRRGGLDPGSTTALGARWTHHWSPLIDTTLEYQRSWVVTPQGRSTPESVGLTLGVQDLLVPGLGIQAGYSASAPDGLTHGGVRSGVRLALNYSLTRTVDTPPTLVKLFGGRHGGEVRGTLYLDANYNSQRDPDEPGLGGVTLEIGGVRATSAPDGSFTLRVPVGSFTPSYVSGVPATLESLSAETVSVKENSTNRLDVPFAPVVHVEVLAYEDTNRNGQRDPAEDALPYVSVQFSGAAPRTVQADLGGKAQISTLPPGRYQVGFSPAGLPENYTPTGPGVSVTVRAGERPAVIELGAAPPLKQNVNTFSSGTLALLGTLSTPSAVPGDRVQLRVRVQHAETLQVTAFGQTFTPLLSDGQATQELTVPSTLAPGTYDIEVTASQGNARKVTQLKLLVFSP